MTVFSWRVELAVGSVVKFDSRDISNLKTVQHRSRVQNARQKCTPVNQSPHRLLGAIKLDYSSLETHVTG